MIYIMNNLLPENNVVPTLCAYNSDDYETTMDKESPLSCLFVCYLSLIVVQLRISTPPAYELFWKYFTRNFLFRTPPNSYHRMVIWPFDGSQKVTRISFVRYTLLSINFKNSIFCGTLRVLTLSCQFFSQKKAHRVARNLYRVWVWATPLR